MEEGKRPTWYIFSEYRNVLMGLAILGIILFHHTEDCRAAGVLGNSGLRWWYYTYIRSSFVETFVFLSGFGLYFSCKRKKTDKRTFYARRFARILVPYVLIAIPAYALREILGGTSESILKEFFFVSFFEGGARWFWFILMIGVCYLIFPYVFELFESAKDRITEYMYLLSVFSFFTVICLLLQSNNGAFFGNVQIALLRFPEFFLGCLIGKAAYERREIPGYMWWLIPLSFLMLPLAVGSKIMLVRYVLGFFNFCLCLLFALCMKLISALPRLHGGIRAALELCGKYSLELYLSHVAVRKIMKLCECPTYRIRYELILLAISIVLSLLLNRLSNLILNRMGRKNIQAAA